MAYDQATDPETPLPPPPRRRRRRIRSSAKFWVAFVIVVLGGVAAAAALVGSGDSEQRLGNRVEAGRGDKGSGSSGGDATTTTAPAFEGFREYAVTDGVNIRSGPGTTYGVLGTVQTGHKVFVICWAEGDTIDGPSGPTNKWVKVVFGTTIGYITNQFVDTRADINNPQLIAMCETL